MKQNFVYSFIKRGFNRKVTFVCFTTITIYFSFFLNCFSQQNPPGIMWEKVYWATDNPFTGAHNIPQDQSGDEWNFSVKASYNSSGTIDEYIYAGYSTVRNQAPPAGYGLTSSNILCQDFETSTNVKGVSLPKLMATDVNGKLLWYKTYGLVPACCSTAVASKYSTSGVLGSGYVAVGHTFETGSTIDYNPDATHPNQTLVNYNTTGFQNNLIVKRIMVLKTDDDGNLLWKKSYGFDNNLSGNQSFGQANDVIELSNGDLLVCGRTTDLDASNLVPDMTGINPNIVVHPNRAFLMRLDADGNILWKFFYGMTHSYSVFNGMVLTTNNKVALIGQQFTNSFYTDQSSNIKYNDCEEANKIFCEQIDISTGNVINSPVYFSDDPSGLSGDGAESIAYDAVQNYLVFPVIYPNATKVSTPTTANPILLSRGYGLMNVIAVDANNLSNSSVILANQLVEAYDLRTGIVLDANRNIGVVSSIVPSSYVPPTPSSYSACAYCSGAYPVVANHWGSDAKIWKLSPLTSSGTSSLLWSTSFDDYTTPLGCFPNNLKKQECVYSIAPAPDGGYVITGNDGSNFDDDYAVRIYGDCQSAITYDVNSITYYNNASGISTYTWSGNATQNIGGLINVGQMTKLVIPAGFTLQFADSRRVGHPCGIIVQPGGLLEIENGATLTSIPGCDGMWDGIQVLGDPYNYQISNAGSSICNYGTVNIGLTGSGSNALIENARYGVITGDLAYDPWMNITRNYSSTGYNFHDDPNWYIQPYSAGGKVNAKHTVFHNCMMDVAYKTYSYAYNSLLEDNKFVCDNNLTDPELINPEHTAAGTFAHVFIEGGNSITIAGNEFTGDDMNHVGGSWSASNGPGNTYNTPLAQLYDAGTREYGIYAVGSVGYRVAKSTNTPLLTAQQENVFDNFNFGIYDISYVSAGMSSCFIDNTIFKKNDIGLCIKGDALAKITNNKFVDVPVNYNIISNVQLYMEGATNYIIENNEFGNINGNTANSIGTYITNSGPRVNTMVYRNQFHDMGYACMASGVNGDFNASALGKPGLQYKCNDFSNNINGMNIMVVDGQIKQNQGYCSFNQNDQYTAPAGNLWANYSNSTDISPQIFLNIAPNTGSYAPYADFDNVTNQLNYHAHINDQKSNNSIEWMPATSMYDPTVTNVSDCNILNYSVNQTNYAEACPSMSIVPDCSMPCRQIKINNTQAAINSIQAVDPKHADPDLEAMRSGLIAQRNYEKIDYLQALADSSKYDTIRSFLTAETDIDSKFLLVKLLIGMHQLTDAATELNNISSNAQEDIDEKAMLQFKLNLRSQDRADIYISPTGVATLREIADRNKTMVGMEAKNWLVHIGAITDDTHIRLLDLPLELMRKRKEVAANSTAMGDFKLFPNPSNSQITINSSKATMIKIEVTDLVGKLLQTIVPAIGNSCQIDVSKYAAGTYFVNIADSDAMNTKMKFEVVK